MNNDPNHNPTGESCSECGAVQYFVPGYLTEDRVSGKKYFTVSRQTHHEEACPTQQVAMIATHVRLLAHPFTGPSGLSDADRKMLAEVADMLERYCAD